MDPVDRLFSYGTLQREAVQRDRFGRVLTGVPDRLIGYRVERLAISNPAVVALSGEAVHPDLRETRHPEDTVDGMVFSLSAAEMAAADDYEASDYRRIRVRLQSGTLAWVYVGR